MSNIRENDCINFRRHILKLKKKGHQVKCETSSTRNDNYTYIWVNEKFYLKLEPDGRVAKVGTSGLELYY